ncbi:MAG: serine hydrolase domain-containing protein [Acidimicrobiales bacterium]
MPESVGMSSERLGWMRSLMERHVASGRSPSAAAVVVRRGKVVLQEAFGVQRPGGPELEIDHVWPLASAGKPLTAAVAMTLVEEGHVGITQPIVDFFPELRGSGNDDVLVHHLFTHTAGWESAQRTHRIEAMVADGSLPPLPEGHNFVDHMFRSLAFDPIRSAAPGEQMDYDNSHYTLLSEIVRRVTGDTLDAAMRTRIFEPLGLERSAVIVDDALRPHVVQRAPGLPFGPDALLSFEGEVFESCDSGAAGVFMSPTDLAAFGQAILEGGSLGAARVLAPSTVRSMVTNQLPGVPAKFGERLLPEASWGYGFTVRQPRGFSFFSGGLTPDGTAMHPGAGGISYWIDFENEIVAVFFEVITKMSEFYEPVSGISHRLQDVVVGAVAS